MRFQPTPIAGVVEISVDWQQDARGSFGRTFCCDEFAAQGLNPKLAQCSISRNSSARTVRGFHLQAKPHEEAKLVQCIAGRMLDVALDLRTGSPTYGRHHAVELSAQEGKMLYIPEGCAHGFQTLENDTAIMYYISTNYEPAAGRGVRWDDPALNVVWPFTLDVVVNERDRALPLLDDYAPGA
jgi:dTDP-4-dehydrorhamnose 3,5-epimerase